MNDLFRREARHVPLEPDSRIGLDVLRIIRTADKTLVRPGDGPLNDLLVQLLPGSGLLGRSARDHRVSLLRPAPQLSLDRPVPLLLAAASALRSSMRPSARAQRLASTSFIDTLKALQRA